MRNVLLATAALTLIAAPAMAQDPASPVTGSIGYTHLDGDDGSLGAVTGRLGYRFTPYIGIEGEASVGVQDEDVGTVPVSPNVELFGRVGYGTTSLKGEVAGVDVSEDGESINYGAGANWFFDGQNGVRADWTRRDFREDDGGEIDTYGLSYVRRF